MENETGKLKHIMLLTAALVITFSIILGQSVHAETIEGLELITQSNKSALAISPAIIEKVLTPEKTETFTLLVTNLTSFPLPISGTVKNFVALEEIEDDRKRELYDASKWFTVNKPDFILQPKQTRQISVSITPPKGSEPGGHYATVYFQPLLPEAALTPSTAYLSARIGALAFLIMPGALDEKLTIDSFSVPKVHISGDVPFTMLAHNEGNVHLSPNSSVIIRNWRGKKVAERTIKASIILPGTQKIYATAWDKPLGFGKYTAIVEISYGTEGKNTSESATFWIVPWTMVVLLCILLPATIVAIRTRGRWKKAWRILQGKS